MTLVRRLSSRFNRTIGLFDQIFDQCAGGTRWSEHVGLQRFEPLGQGRGVELVDDSAQPGAAVSASGWANTVRINAAIICRRRRWATASRLRIACTQQRCQAAADRLDQADVGLAPEHPVSASPMATPRTSRHPVSAQAGGNHGRPGHHVAHLADVDVGGAQPDINERLMIPPAGAQHVDVGVDPGTDPCHRRLRDPTVTARARTRSSTLRVDASARLERLREERADAQLGNPDLDVTGRGGDELRAVPVAQRRALRACSPGAARSSWSINSWIAAARMSRNDDDDASAPANCAARSDTRGSSSCALLGYLVAFENHTMTTITRQSSSPTTRRDSLTLFRAPCRSVPTLAPSAGLSARCAKPSSELSGRRHGRRRGDGPRGRNPRPPTGQTHRPRSGRFHWPSTGILPTSSARPEPYVHTTGRGSLNGPSCRFRRSAGRSAPATAADMAFRIVTPLGNLWSSRSAAAAQSPVFRHRRRQAFCTATYDAERSCGYRNESPALDHLRERLEPALGLPRLWPAVRPDDLSCPGTLRTRPTARL